MTEPMRWAVVVTFCAVVILAAIAGIVAISPEGAEQHQGCRGHGGVVRVIDGADSTPRHVACRDGTVVDL